MIFFQIEKKKKKKKILDQHWFEHLHDTTPHDLSHSFKKCEFTKTLEESTLNMIVIG